MCLCVYVVSGDVEPVSSQFSVLSSVYAVCLILDLCGYTSGYKKRRKKKGNKQRKKESERCAKRNKMLNVRIGEKGRHVDMNVQTTRLPETTKRKRSVKREIPAFESRQDEARPYFLIVQSNRIPIELDEKMKGR